MFKRISFFFCLLLALATVLPALAGDKGPDRLTKTGAATASVSILPCGDAERFTPEFLVCNAPASQTQTVYQVVGGTNTVGGAVTNLVGTYVPAAGAKSFAITNCSDFFQNDTFLIVPSGGNLATTNTYWLIGNKWN